MDPNETALSNLVNERVWIRNMSFSGKSVEKFKWTKHEICVRILWSESMYKTLVL